MTRNAGETRRAETTEIGSVHEHAVGEADAPELLRRISTLTAEIEELRAVVAIADELVNGEGLYTVAYADTPKLCVREKKDGSDPHARLCDALATLKGEGDKT